MFIEPSAADREWLQVVQLPAPSHRRSRRRLHRLRRRESVAALALILALACGEARLTWLLTHPARPAVAAPAAPGAHVANHVFAPR
jgi:hypothetical protein